MTRPDADIAGCREAHGRMTALLGGDAVTSAGEASRLAGWTVGHVLTHLARNAEAMVRRVDAARLGEQVEPYEGGAAGRAAAIDAGASRGLPAIADDVRDWSARLDRSFVELDEAVWSFDVRASDGSTHPLADLPFRRWREVEFHLVDLGVGVTPDDWSPAFVDRALPRLLANLPDLTDRRRLAAWIVGRSDPPMLEPWG